MKLLMNSVNCMLHLTWCKNFDILVFLPDRIFISCRWFTARSGIIVQNTCSWIRLHNRYVEGDGKHIITCSADQLSLLNTCNSHPLFHCHPYLTTSSRVIREKLLVFTQNIPSKRWNLNLVYFFRQIKRCSTAIQARLIQPINLHFISLISL
jgi:hypothetical protein